MGDLNLRLAGDASGLGDIPGAGELLTHTDGRAAEGQALPAVRGLSWEGGELCLNTGGLSCLCLMGAEPHHALHPDDHPESNSVPLESMCCLQKPSGNTDFGPMRKYSPNFISVVPMPLSSTSSPRKFHLPLLGMLVPGHQSQHR